MLEAYLTISNSEQSFEVELTPMQLKTIAQILMIDFDDEGNILVASDETLLKLYKYKGNPLNLQYRTK